MSKLISTNPAKNYERLGEIDISSAEEIKQKVVKARKAFPEWKKLGVSGRIEALRPLLDYFTKHKKEIAVLETKEMGMPISQSLGDVDFGLDYFKWYLDNAAKYLTPETTFEDDNSIHQVHYEPIGVAAVIIPWNFPFSNFIWGVGQNLVVGNTVVMKHSEEVPLTGKLMENVISDIALPDGVFSEIYGSGEVGDILMQQDINLLSFTGSTKVGQGLYKKVADKFIKVCLELGGSSPGIIFADADLDKALEVVYAMRFSNSGQVCDSLKRLIVHESVFDETVAKLAETIKPKKIGDPEDESIDIGPLVAKRQLELLESQMKDAIEKKAKVVIGGGEP